MIVKPFISNALNKIAIFHPKNYHSPGLIDIIADLENSAGRGGVLIDRENNEIKSA